MPQAFIAMPFDQKFYPVYKAIKAACESLEIKVIRIDEVWAREDIYKQIEEEILKSDFVVADFTGDRLMEVTNPNVVHEAAFARTKKKYLILMAQDHKCLPFDWRTRPAIIYNTSEDGLSYLKDRLVIGIRALMEKEDFGMDYAQMSSPHNFVPMGMPQAPIPVPVPMYPNPANLYNQYDASALGNIENLLRNKQNSTVILNTNSVIPLPKGFMKKNDRIICQIDQSEMIRIPATEFLMGGEDEEDQEPIHKVKLGEYLIDKYPVTNEKFAKFIEAGGYQYQGFWNERAWAWRSSNKVTEPLFWLDSNLNNPDQPVVGVTWYEAMAYAVWLGKHLPTEAQWELAARGTDERPYPWGTDKPASDLCNYRSVSKSSTPVNNFSKGVSPYGCYDMAGNIWEWCYDWFDEDYYQAAPEINPIGPFQGEDKACRGGSWTYGTDTLKTFYRFTGEVTVRDKSYGFRCARIL